MFTLLNHDDSKLMSKANFVKNASFYKDMLAFYDAFESVLRVPKEQLPNFCLFSDKNYCLDGLCLLIKMYQSEFGFESIRVSQEYLKVLYYCICGYSVDNETVLKDAILEEMEQYYLASKKMESKLSDEFNDILTSTNYSNQKVKTETTKMNFSSKNAGLSHVLYVFFFVFAFFSAMLPFTFYYLGKFEFNLTILLSASVLVAGLMLYFFFKMLNKHFIEKKNDFAYSLQGQKKKNQELNRKFIRSKDAVSRLICEKYEYEHSFNDAISKYSKKLSIQEIVKRASGYNLLTYNQLMDINRLFDTWQREEETIVDEVKLVSEFNEPFEKLKQIYEKITQNDWLYFNQNVRCHFISKLIEIAKKMHCWTLNIDGKETAPFDISVKKMVTEKVAYLENIDEPFLTSSYYTIEKTAIVQKLQIKKDFDQFSIDEERQIKANYINHFYNYEKLKKYDNLFEDKRIDENVKVSKEIIEGKQYIPIVVLLKLKQSESDMGYENFNSNAIKQIADNILKVSRNQLENLSAKEITSVISTYPSTVFVSEVDSMEDLSDSIKYVIGGREFIGYKLVI